MEAFIAHLGAHPAIALVVLACVSFAESLAVVGTFVPAAVVLLSAGALVGTGLLDWWPAFACAAVGAVCGDALSYELGRRREARIRALRLFRARADLVARAERFVRRHGARSVVLARFVAPVRAFVPLLAGFSRLPRARFYLSDVVSALLWAPAHLLPGVVLGQSLRVAEAVSARLAIAFVLLAAIAVAAAWIVRSALRFAVPLLRGAQDRMLSLSRRHSRAWPARVTLALLDPERPASRALLLGACLVLGAGWLFLGVLEDVVTNDPLVAADHAVFLFLQGLRTPTLDRAMVGITEMGSIGVLLPLFLVVTAWLLWRRCLRSAAFWAVVAVVGEAFVQIIKWTLGRARPAAVYTGLQQFSFPSGHATSSTVILGFLAFLLSRGRSVRARLAIAAAVSVYVALVAFSRLYLGAHWLSDVVGGMSLGLAWVALAAMLYVRHRVQEPVGARWLTLLCAATIAASGALWIAHRADADMQRYASRPATRVVPAAQWPDPLWSSLPMRRVEFAGEPEEVLDLQFACTSSGVRHALNILGWSPAPAWTLQNALAALAPHPDAMALPVLPRFDRGSPAELVFVRPAPGRPDARDVLRLWRAQVVLDEPDATRVPLWYGTAYRDSPRKIGLGLAIERPVPIAGAEALQSPSQGTSNPWQARTSRTSGNGAQMHLLSCAAP